MLSLKLKGFSIFLLMIFLSPQSVNAQDEGTRENPINANISILLADPWTYDGQFVRVTGTFDDCSEFYCAICEAESDLIELAKDRHSFWYEERNEHPVTEDRCAQVDFGFGDYSLPDPTPNDRFYFWGIETEMDHQISLAAMFSTATIEAEFHANCIAPRKNPETGDLVICKSSLAFLDAKFIEFHQNRPATQGVFGGVRSERLIIPLNKEANALKRANRRANFSWPNDIFGEPQELAFLFPKIDSSKYRRVLRADGGVCICVEDHCEKSDWPKLVGHVLSESPMNPYFCQRAIKRRGKWVFPINF